jgi:hypothetical protein
MPPVFTCHSFRLRPHTFRAILMQPRHSRPTPLIRTQYSLVTPVPTKLGVFGSLTLRMCSSMVQACTAFSTIMDKPGTSMSSFPYTGSTVLTLWERASSVMTLAPNLCKSTMLIFEKSYHRELPRQHGLARKFWLGVPVWSVN